MHLISLLTLAVLASASPIVRRSTIGAADLITVFPSTASCDGAPSAGECVAAAQAVPYLAAGFTNFGITDFNTQAALVALMLYESGGFKYSKNHYPGVPGQGTRNMQSPQYNTKYAKWLAAIPGSGIAEQAVDAAIAQGPAALLALVNSDQWSFESAAWFLKTQCSAQIKQGLAAGTQAGWSAYLTQCVGTAATNDRTQIWDKIMSLGRWSS